MSKRIRQPALLPHYRLLAALLSLLWIGACSPQPQTARLTVIVSGNTVGYLENCGCSGGQMGGMARRATQVKQELAKAEKPGPKDGRHPAASLLLDCGNFSDTTQPVRALETKGVMQAMAAMGYESVGLGVNELDLRQERLLSLLTTVKLPYTAANLSFVKPAEGDDHSAELSPLVRPYLVLRKPGGLRVGILHLVDSSRIDPKARERLGYRIDEPLLSARAMLKEHGREADLWLISVGGLRHSTLDQAMLAELPGVRAVAGLAVSGQRTIRRDPGQPAAGPDGKAAKPETKKPERPKPGILIGRPLDKGKDLVLLTLPIAVSEDAQPKPLHITLGDRIPEDPLVQSISTALKPEREKIELTYAEEAMALLKGGKEHPYYLGWNACAACHKAEADALASSKHMHAYETLRAKDKQHTSCAKCHTLGYNRASGYNVILDRQQAGDWVLRNVQCENCHGPGEYHVLLQQGKPAPEDLMRRGRNAQGLVPANRSSCSGCHDHENSPNFSFETYWPKIEHGKKESPGPRAEAQGKG